MAGKSDTFEGDLLRLIFNGTAIANIADNAANAPNTLLWVALHTADPQAGATEGSAQTTSEATYTSYARVSVARTSAGWAITTDGNGITGVSPVNPISFPQATGGTNSITHFSVGTAQTGTGRILYAGAVTPTISVTAGVQPQLTTGTRITED
jgi:hypothetical protein